MNIIFDLDGTLIDSAPDIQYVANTVLQRRGLTPITIEQTRSFVGEGAKVFVQKMMDARAMQDADDRFDEVHAEFIAVYEGAVERAVFYPGVQETLEELANEGHALALCTNKPEAPTRAVLSHMGLDAAFPVVVAGGMLPTRKPDPEMLLEANALAGGGTALYVGDSEIDAQTAKRAEIPFALFTEGYRKTPVEEMHHDFLFSEFAELPAIVARTLGG